ncbi:hypothetical protein FD21_GL000938 [Liquorilactobacillus vini DSM 20605]|uniref:Integral membrane protein n=2 Tax=Liquorilactobacillus vini TaxID=238015 RepID=A0A0R2CBE5_9LACO|nr:hypothetical protein FD21_GL000938 [Liquorilactobacillus vini DSM 20605]
MKRRESETMAEEKETKASMTEKEQASQTAARQQTSQTEQSDQAASATGAGDAKTQSQQAHLSNKERNQKVAQQQAELLEKQTKKELKTEIGIYAGLTKRNENYLYRLNKILTEKNYDQAKKEAVLQDLAAELREKQGKGITANRLYGTPSDKADEIIAGPKKKPQPVTFWKMAVDNGLMMLVLFCAMYAIMGLVSPKAIKVNGGVLTLLVTSVLAGVGMAFFYQMAADRKAKKVRLPFWKMLLWSVILIAVWMLVFTAVAAIPGAVNSALNPIAYAVIAALAYLLRYYLKKKYDIRSTPF